MREPDSGLALLHGLDRHSLGGTAWRHHVALAPQFHENHVFTETFAFNLLMGRDWPPTPEDLAEAAAVCRELGLGDLLARMPSGLQQIVGESGWQLSHGERSRLYMARALLQRTGVVVLDESFAALDPENLQQALDCALRRAPALLVIAHPLEVQIWNVSLVHGSRNGTSSTTNTRRSLVSNHLRPSSCLVWTLHILQSNGWRDGHRERFNRTLRRSSIMNKTAIFLIALPLTASPALGSGFSGPTDGVQNLGYSCYGCTSLAFQGSVIQMRLQGISPNTAVYSAPDTDLDIKTSDGTCRDTDYLALARLSGALATSGNIPRPFLLDLSAVIFGTTPERSCTVSSDLWSVRSDWQARLNNFKAVSGTNFNTSTVWSIVLFSEVANQHGMVVGNAKINEIAAYVKQLWPGIPVMAGYPTAAAQPDYGMQYTPSIFPWRLDYIVTWDYDVKSPTDPRYAGDGVNPGAYGSLLSRLRSYQKLLYNVGIFTFGGPPTTCPARSPINGERFDLLARNWCDWAFNTHRDRSLGLVMFFWGPAQHYSPNTYGAQHLINWELSQCGGTALKPALISVTNAASMGTSCWQ